MKEVKFRGKRVDNGAWVYGVPYAEYMICGTATAYYDDEVPMSKYVEFYYKEVDPVTVGQCTGLKDKNSKDIFEGDVLHCVARLDEGILAVIFEEGEFRQVLCEWHNNPTTSNGYYSMRSFHKEVIGNIHDNPELLRGAKARPRRLGAVIISKEKATTPLQQDRRPHPAPLNSTGDTTCTKPLSKTGDTNFIKPIPATDGRYYIKTISKTGDVNYIKVFLKQ